MDIEKFKETVESIKRPPEVPAGEFCSADLVKQGMMPSQVNKLLANLVRMNEVEFTQKRQGRKINGDIKMVAYYRMVSDG